VDLQSNRAVPGVELLWQAVRSSDFTRTMTNVDGIYRAELAVADAYNVSGANRISGVVRVPGVFLLSDFLINTGGYPTWYGVVTDVRTGQPVSGVSVTWFGVTSVTTTTGEYRIIQPRRDPTPPGVIPNFGTTTLSVGHPGYVGQIDFGPRSETIGFSPGEIRQDYALMPR
jgi:hypothetical protein